MKAIFKRATSAILVLAIAAMSMLLVPSVDVEASSKMTYDKKVVDYMTDSSGKSSGYGDFINIYNPTAKIKKSSIKNSNPKVIKILGVDNQENEAHIRFDVKRVGTTTVTFKVGSKKCTTKVKIKKYTNPAKTIKISGVKSGKNIASKFNKTSDSNNFTLPKTTKNAKLKVKAASGWKLTNAYIQDTTTSKTVLSKVYPKGTAKKKSYNLGTLKKGHWYDLTLEFQNQKNGAYIWLFFDINRDR